MLNKILEKKNKPTDIYPFQLKMINKNFCWGYHYKLRIYEQTSKKIENLKKSRKNIYSWFFAFKR